MTRGLRNNNPLNIRHSADQWQGIATTQTDKSFVQFQSMAYGYRAAWKILDTYCLRFRRERLPYHVRNIITRWHLQARTIRRPTSATWSVSPDWADTRTSLAPTATATSNA